MALGMQRQTAAERAKLKIKECEDDILLARDKLEVLKFLDKVIDSLKSKIEIYIQLATTTDEANWIMMIEGNQSGAQISIKTWRNKEQVEANIVPWAEEIGLVLDDRVVCGNMIIYRAHISRK